MNNVELFELARKGDKAAKEKIVSENTGLVWSIADRMYRTFKGNRKV